MRVGTQGLFRPYLKTFVLPFLPTRLTTPGSPRKSQTLFSFSFFLGLEKNESVPIPVIPLPSVPSTEQKDESVQISISVTTNQVRARKIETIRFRKSGATEVGINKGIAGSMIRSNFLLDFACLPLRIYVGGKIAGKKK